MAPILPLLPGGGLPPAPLLLRWLQRTASAGSTAITLPIMPDGNGSLPDLCRLAGITMVVWGRAGEPLRWEGWGGGRVILVASADAPTDAVEDAHCGELPAEAADLDDAGDFDAAALLALVDLARLEDAASFLDRGSDGAAWDALLDVLEGVTEVRHPPVLALTGTGSGFPATLWNPLPFRRVVLAAMPAGDGPAPWSLRDAAGGRHAVQVTEGPFGAEWLVASPISGLGGLALEPCEDAVAGSHWEVAARVLDNGRVRAELDDAGRLVRLCLDGMFAELAGPALAPTVDGLPWSGVPELVVVEDGPVRARVLATTRSPAGTLSVAYTLIAGEDCLRITATWNGEVPCVLDIPTAQRAADLHAAAGLARWSRSQRLQRGVPDPVAVRGVRWAALGDAGGRGLAVIGGRPFAVSAQAGHLYVPVERLASFAIAASRRPSGALSLGHLGEHLAAGGRRIDAVAPPSPLRLAETGAVVPLWARRPEGCAGELLLAETAGARGRIHLYPPDGIAGGTCWRVDAAGNRLSQISATPEGDGWVADLAAGEIALVRWTVGEA